MSTTITTESILNEDGAEAVLAEYGKQVRAGETAIRKLVEAEPGRVWGFSELREAAREGRRKTAMGAALRSLAAQGILAIDYTDYTVKAS
jgi:hypothetical protein